MSNLLELQLSNNTFNSNLTSLKDLVKESYLRLKEVKRTYKEFLYFRRVFKDLDKKNYSKVIKKRSHIKKSIHSILLMIAKTLTLFIRNIVLYLEQNIQANKLYIKSLVLCLIKKISFVIQKCYKYSDKKINRIKKSKITTLKHSNTTYSYKKQLDKVNEDLNKMISLYGSIDDIKISNRKDYVKEIYDNLVKAI